MFEKKHITKAIQICKNERYWRTVVFKNKPDKLDGKLKEMDFVIIILQRLLESSLTSQE